LKYFFKGKSPRLIVLGILCVVLLGNVFFTSVPKQLKLYAYPQKYVQAMSSTPGIRISAEYSGKVDKVRYSTEYGGFLTWKNTSGIITEYEQCVELPYDMKVYWTPYGDNTIRNVTDISVKVTILGESEKVLAEKEVNILCEGFYTVQASRDVVIGIKGQ